MPSPAVAPEPQSPAKRTPAFRLAVAAGAVAVVVSLALVRYLAADEEYEVADASFGSQVVTNDPESTVEPITKPTATAPAPVAAAPAAAALVAPIVRAIAATQPVVEAASAPPRKAAKTAIASAPAPPPVATPVVETHTPEPAPAAAAASAAADPSATKISPVAAPAALATASVTDEVTITGCLETAKDEDGFRLADTEGANAPQARSWRSGFFKKRPAPVDLIGPTDAMSLRRQVGRRVAATGVLSGRELKVSSVRIVSGSCN